MRHVGEYVSVFSALNLPELLRLRARIRGGIPIILRESAYAFMVIF